jgi:hypothetical protein
MWKVAEHSMCRGLYYLPPASLCHAARTLRYLFSCPHGFEDRRIVSNGNGNIASRIQGIEMLHRVYRLPSQFYSSHVEF